MSKISQIREIVQNGVFYLTEQALHEAGDDGLDIYDVEFAIMSGKIRRSWPRENKFEIIGEALDERKIGVLCRITLSRKVRVITVYEDKQK